MSKTYLHKQKGKSKHGLYGESFENLPFKVKKYYDRHCGLKDDMLSKREVMEKELKNIDINNIDEEEDYEQDQNQEREIE